MVSVGIYPRGRNCSRNHYQTLEEPWSMGSPPLMVAGGGQTALKATCQNVNVGAAAVDLSCVICFLTKPVQLYGYGGDFAVYAPLWRA